MLFGTKKHWRTFSSWYETLKERKPIASLGVLCRTFWSGGEQLTFIAIGFVLMVYNWDFNHFIILHNNHLVSLYMALYYMLVSQLLKIYRFLVWSSPYNNDNIHKYTQLCYLNWLLSFFTKHLCRQGREAVQITYSTDILNSNDNVFDDESSSSSSPDIQGYLLLRLANIGHRKEQISKEITIRNNNRKKYLISQRDATCFRK